MIQEAFPTVARDPVCGMDVEIATAKHTSEWHGQTYSFCSLMCKRAFEDDPRHYLGGRRRRPAGAKPAAGR